MWYKVNKIYVWTTKVRPSSRLPNTYQEVEYIQTTWTQFIDTGLYPWNNIQVETKIEVTTTTQDISVFWCYKTWEWLYTNSYYQATSYNNCWNLWLYWDGNNVNTASWTYNPTVWTQYTIIFNGTNNWFYLNWNNLATLTWTKWKDWSTLSIARRWWTNTTSWVKYWQYKYFYFRIYNKSTGQYVRNMIPWYRKSDNVIWLYDLVNKQFYTNSWSWTFTKWPDVN